MRVCEKLEILGLTGESMATLNDDIDLKEVTHSIVESDDIIKEEGDRCQKPETDNLSESVNIILNITLTLNI